MTVMVVVALAELVNTGGPVRVKTLDEALSARAVVLDELLGGRAPKAGGDRDRADDGGRHLILA
jgi:hypothetical protein